MPLDPLPDRPLVSVIVPSYNQGRFIRDTIESTLSQPYRPLELVVIDGASTDETLEVLKSYAGVPELRWWSEPDSGVVEAVNKGFERARGQIGAIQSSDDFYLPDVIGQAVDALVEDSDLGFVYGDIIKVDSEGRELMRTDLPPFTLERMLSCQTWVPQPSTFFRLDLAKRLGGWRGDIPYAPDTDLWIKIAFRSRVRKLDVVMAKRRMHEAQRDTQGTKVADSYGRMIDTSEDIAHAPKNLRRAAKAGKLLNANRYGYGDSYWTKLWRQWRAAMLYPPVFKMVPAAAFVPGWYPLRGLATRIARVCRGRGAAANERFGLRTKAGVLLIDGPRYAWRLAQKGGWIHLRNRGDTLQPASDGLGVAFESDSSTDLHACHVFPALGRIAMKRATAEWPFSMESGSRLQENARLTFVIPHRGRARVPGLIAVLRSVLAQQDVPVECIVVEQNAAREVEGLPEGVRYIHLPHPSGDDAWRKCWAFNVGVAAAQTDIVVCHDSDILVPMDYGREILRLMAEADWEIVHLHRFLFCLDEADTARVVQSGQLASGIIPERVRQGWKGGTLAIRRESYFRVGGFDESFVGWTGEDMEFYDRCRVLKGWRFGYLPFIHLWHPPQPSKVSAGDRARNSEHTEEVMAVSREERVARLCQSGQMERAEEMRVG